MKDLWVPISAAVAQQRQVEVLANNVANANTPGFKKDKLVFKEYLTALDKGISDIDLPNKEWAPEDFYRSYGSENSQVIVDGQYTIHDQGQLVPTNNSFDFAISGPGFFEILSPSGIRFTRKGTFSLSPDGYLINEQGFHVLSQKTEEGNSNPEERKISVGSQRIAVGPDGSIFSGNQFLGKMSLVEFTDLHALRKIGNGLFSNSFLNNRLVTSLKSQIHQGVIESSNVNAISEMSSLIKANRHFESIQRAIKAYDQISGRGVNEISKF